MSGEEKTVVFADSLGTAVWEYIPANKKAWGYFSASGVTENDKTPFNVTYEHVFFSRILSEEENKKIIADLADKLKSIGAIDIRVEIKIITPVAQQANASYTIPKVEQDNVDSLSTAIASVSKDLIDVLAV